VFAPTSPLPGASTSPPPSVTSEAVDALARTNADYSRHATAARRVAAEYFGAERVLGRLLADARLA
jgi:hypothetical protein